MTQQINAKEVKKKLYDFLEMVGPSLPVHVAKHLQMNTLFASAFLSEMSSEGTVKISNMKVGGSPLYYIPAKESMLENFIKSLDPKDKETCTLLKEKSILEDSIQTPLIRVSLRSLKDFAFPFKHGERIYWRYFLVSELEAIAKLEGKNKEQNEIKNEAPTLEVLTKPVKEETPEDDKNRLEKVKEELVEKQKELEKAMQKLELLEKEGKVTKEKELEIEETKEKIKVKKQKEPKAIKKKPEESFLIEIKETLAKKGIQLIKVDKADKKEIWAIVSIQDKESLLLAINKKKVDDSDLVRAYRKSFSLGLPYYILSKGEPSKKTKEAIEAHKRLSLIEKIDNSPKTSEQ